MEKLDKKYYPISLLLYGMLLFSCYAMVISFNSGTTWKMVFSITGFSVFLGLAIVYTRSLYKMVFESEHES